MRRLVPSVMFALACLAAIGAVAPAAGALTRDAQVKQGIRLLKVYVDGYAAAHSFVFPAAAVVKRGGGLTAPVWPVNPWTGRPMAPGTGRGAYTYVPAADRVSYTLVGHLASGRFSVSGGAPDWLATERNVAAADHVALAAAVDDLAAALQERDAAVSDAMSARQERTAALTQLATAQDLLAASQAELATTNSNLQAAQTSLSASQAALASSQADLATARDRAAELGVRVVKGYVEQWGMLYNATAPTREQVAKTGAVGSMFTYWPSNPFTGQPMADSVAAGDFSYGQNVGGTSYALTAHATATNVTLDGTVPQQLRNALDTARSSLTNANIHLIQQAVDRYASDNSDTFPANASSATLSPYLDFWPVNPWTNNPMNTSSTGQGDCRYTNTMSGYAITAYVSGGVQGDTVDESWLDRWLGIRDHLKNTYCQAAAHVLKEYVDEWKTAHAGTPPTVEQLTKAGEAGSLHAWWPTNPWLGMPMTNGDTKGDFQYAPDAGGVYTLTVRQQPDAYFTQYYTPE